MAENEGGGIAGDSGKIGGVPAERLFSRLDRIEMHLDRTDGRIDRLEDRIDRLSDKVQEILEKLSFLFGNKPAPPSS